MNESGFYWHWPRHRARGALDLVCLALVISAYACTNSTSTHNQSSDHNNLDVQTEKPGMTDLKLSLAPVDPPGTKLEATLLNAGEQTVLVNARLGVSRPQRGGDLHLSLTDAEGNELPFTARVNIGKPMDAEFKQLAPGESATRIVDLADYFQLRDKSGTLEVAGTYANQYPGPGGQAAWTGEVQAAPISLTLP